MDEFEEALVKAMTRSMNDDAVCKCAKAGLIPPLSCIATGRCTADVSDV